MRKLSLALLGLLAFVCISGCGVSTRGAERDVASVKPVAPTHSSPGAVRLARRTPGLLIVAGSTPGSLTARAARAYRAGGGGDTIAIKHASANVAFSALCGGQIDMVDSSRPISNTEIAGCEQSGIRPVQLEVASDAIVLATKTETDVGADCLTVAEVNSMFRAGSPVYNWGQLGFDQLPLSIAGPGPGSSAFRFFDRQVLGSAQPSRLDFRFDYHAKPTNQAVSQFVTGSASDAATASQLTQLDQTVSTLSAVLTGARKTLTDANLSVKEAAFQVTKGVADGRPPATQAQDASTLTHAQAKRKQAQAAVAAQSSQLASARSRIVAGRAAQHRLGAVVGHLGMFPFSYYALFEESLRPLEISTSAVPENCIFPSQQTVTTAAYPLSRQLLITTSAQAAKRPDVRQFLLSYLHNAQRLATRQGLVELPDDVLAREQAYFGTSGQPAAPSSAAPSEISTAGSSAAGIPSTVH